MTVWSLSYGSFRPADEGVREALCTLGNGYFATRGAAPEASADGVHYPGTYLAGGYNRLATEIAGRVIENEDLVNLPNWLPLTFRIPGEPWFSLDSVDILSFRQDLDLKQGVLHRTLRFRDGKGRESTLAQRRLVHMADPHMAGLETVLIAENWSGDVEFLSALDGTVVNAGVARYRSLAHRHLAPLSTSSPAPDIQLLEARTIQSGLKVSLAARTRVYAGTEPVEVPRRTEERPGYIGQAFTARIEERRPLRVEKVVALYTSRDHAVSEPGAEAAISAAKAETFEELLQRHVRIWEMLWHRFDMELELSRSADGDRMGLILHLHLFHLLQTVSLHTIDLDVGVPARGWHGEAYRGHIFWDEIFILPFITLRFPEITRALLMYRYRRLREARRAARAAGYQGAMFPWQSGSNGREESQVMHLNPTSGRWIPDHTYLQRHVNAAIAYNLWQYYQITRDAEFLFFYGAEMILEIARFFGSMATLDPGRNRYVIRGVVGPDEYHDAYPGSERPGIDNNAYTNVMAAWVTWRALEILKRLPPMRREEICQLIELEQAEIDRWEEVSRQMFVPFHGEGIISQFEGFGDLVPLDWERYQVKFGDTLRLDRILEAEGDSPNRYQASKQADVLMLFYLLSEEELAGIFARLGYPFGPDTISRNVLYYLARTSHGSTLSKVVHSWVLARSNRPRSWQLFGQALESDIADAQGGTTHEGIHLGAMAGTVDLVQRAYTGIETREDILWFNPCLPDEITRMIFRIRYRGNPLGVEIAPRLLRITCLLGPHAPIRIGFQDEVRELHRIGEILEFRR